MTDILILGAGKSSSYLIRYLSAQAVQHHWTITVADQSDEMASQKTQGLPHVHPKGFDISDDKVRNAMISQAAIVISMLPPPLHFVIAQTCLRHGKSLLTASYLSEEISALEKEAREKGIVILMEMGLDPGIDHMSAMKEIDRISESGGQLTSFKSYTGGLMAPGSDNNPWQYKVTWNPRNVVLAGQGTVKYLFAGQYKYTSYQQLFTRLYHTSIPGYGDFEGYANRDSLRYLSAYQLTGISNFIRGTFRRPGYAAAWHALVQLGLTDDSFVMENTKGMSYKDFTASFLEDTTGEDIATLFFMSCCIDPASDTAERLRWLGLFGDEKIKLPSGSPAQVMQEIIEDKWRLQAEDKDMVVMQHELEYHSRGKNKKVLCTLVNLGEDAVYTAMSKTVGLPLGIAAKLILTGALKLKGVQVPVSKEIYEPVLQELEEYGVSFEVSEIELLK